MRIAPSDSRTLHRVTRTEAMILFSISGQSFAISASAILEIRSTESISAAATPIEPLDLSKVRHRLHRGRKTYFVVNGCAHFGLPTARPAMVLILRNSRVAVLVDRIDRMEIISLLMALPRSFSGPERTWYRGLALIGDVLTPVVNHSGFLSETELAHLEKFTPATSGLESAPVSGDSAQEQRA